MLNKKYIIIIFFIIFIFFIIINKYLKKEYYKKYDYAILIFHQEWTDIINCLPLINYYNNKYLKLYVVIRDDAVNILKFYIKDLNNIELITFEYKKFMFSQKNMNNYKLCNSIILNNPIISSNSEYLFHGFCDIYTNKNKNKFIKNGLFTIKNIGNIFYTIYDLPLKIRVNYFIFNRDYKLEDLTYNNFIKENGKKYILYHSNNNIDFLINKKNKKYINLNKKSNIFFDYIKILENSIEIHLIDSCWAAFIYLLDAKYNLFKNIKIYLYPIRGYINMFKEPILLDNWIFIKQNSFKIFINLFKNKILKMDV